MRLISTIVDATARVPKRVESNQSLEPGPAALIESNLAERGISMRAHEPTTRSVIQLCRILLSIVSHTCATRDMPPSGEVGGEVASLP